MSKRIILASAALGAVAAAGYAYDPAEFDRLLDAARPAAERAWTGVTANPAPVFVAAATFLMTVGYHAARGKSLRESVEVAATRVTVVPVPAPAPPADENPVLTRAKARTARTQLVADQIGLENRTRQLPEAVKKAEQEVCYTEQGATDAARTLGARKAAHEDAVAKLAVIRREKAAADAELAAIRAELRKLADVV
ncbi:MAG TPA: hypothetical protein VH092_37835 [Urbifossiella sp.]|jgi:hypothetical protein|nr:hypothetical protein [Urbifossiella sp.]